jgi:hypothetical protein
MTSFTPLFDTVRYPGIFAWIFSYEVMFFTFLFRED